MNMDNLNRRLPGQVKMLLPHSRLATFNPSSRPGGTPAGGRTPLCQRPSDFPSGRHRSRSSQDHKKC